MGWRPDWRTSGSVASLAAGTMLMMLGFLMYVGGDPHRLSLVVAGTGLALEFLGFALAYIAYSTVVDGSGA